LTINTERIQAIINKHKGQRRNLIAILLEIQNKYNFLPPASLTQVASALDMPLFEVMSVATFYRAFSLTPRGLHTALVCLGTACHVRGGLKILEEFERKLEVKAGATTPDKRFTLETVACLGCCAIGPVVQIDRDYHGHTTGAKVPVILKKYQKPAGAGKKQHKLKQARSAAS
jgi:NADH:ubiquinone oxidoreductase subunit E